MAKGRRNRSLRKYALTNVNKLQNAGNTTKSLARRLRRVGWTYER